MTIQSMRHLPCTVTPAGLAARMGLSISFPAVVVTPAKIAWVPQAAAPHLIDSARAQARASPGRHFPPPRRTGLRHRRSTRARFCFPAPVEGALSAILLFPRLYFHIAVVRTSFLSQAISLPLPDDFRIEDLAMEIWSRAARLRTDSGVRASFVPICSGERPCRTSLAKVTSSAIFQRRYDIFSEPSLTMRNCRTRLHEPPSLQC